MKSIELNWNIVLGERENNTLFNISFDGSTVQRIVCNTPASIDAMLKLRGRERVCTIYTLQRVNRPKRGIYYSAYDDVLRSSPSGKTAVRESGRVSVSGRRR